MHSLNTLSSGVGYFWQGFFMLNKPGIRRYVIIPLLINTILFSSIIYFVAAQIDGWIAHIIPDWLDWLRWLLWPVLLIFILLVVFFLFSWVGNLVASPFNYLLAEAILAKLTESVPPRDPGWAAFFRDIATGILPAIASELHKMGYFLIRAIPLGILLLIPGIGLISIPLWLAFSAWMLTVEYADYPMGSQGMSFAEQRDALKKRRSMGFGFGAMALLATMVPGLNFLVIPVSVAGATVMWVRSEDEKMMKTIRQQMKQVLQNLKNGETELAEVPCPGVSAGSLLIRTSCSLISSGTERMLVDFGRATLLDKARQQPDKVRMVLDKLTTDGLGPTLAAVRNKLDAPLAMGYCNVGHIEEVGAGVTGFRPGERVVSNGKHAQIVRAPMNLCARVPTGVSNDEATFTVLGAIALQGIRLLAPTLGEAVAVMGLGLIGQLAVQLLRAHGCRVLAMDPNPDRLTLASRFGAEVANPTKGSDPVAVAMEFSRSRGMDGVLITASTRSHEPIHQAALMSRKRGQIILVGSTGLTLSRADFYEKELTFQVSCSYGPGRYDHGYEEKGQDYPMGFVRWTEQRNFEAVLDMMADGRLNVKQLISHRFPLRDVDSAYALLTDSNPSLGIVLEYPDDSLGKDRRTVTISPPENSSLPTRNHTTKRSAVSPASVTVGFIGAGNYAVGTLIPAFRATGARLRAIASATGVSGAYAGRKFGFEQTTTDPDQVLEDSETQVVVIATRHDTHGEFVLKALATGKHVFVEKPLCLTRDELTAIEAASGKDPTQGRGDTTPELMVGFNRRFAPHTLKVRQLLQGVNEPKCLVMTVNAGAISPNHWTRDAYVGGGRIIGEACHFVDLLRFIVGYPIVEYRRSGPKQLDIDGTGGESTSLHLGFADGSMGTIHYFDNGHRSFPKERLEVFVAGRVLGLDNFRRLTGYGWSGFRQMRLWQQDKGQQAAVATFVQGIGQGIAAPIPLREIFEVSRITIDLAGMDHVARQRKEQLPSARIARKI